MQSNNPKNEDKKLKINDNQWCYTNAHANSRRKSKRHRNKGIRQFYQHEVREYLMEYQ